MSTATQAPLNASVSIDPRGPRVTAAVTALVLGAALLLPFLPALLLVAVQALLFAIGATRGVQQLPTAWVFRRFLRPRLGPPGQLEDARPPRFAQGVGLLVAVVALGGFASGLLVVAQVAVGLALVAALLNAVFGLCLGCELYLLLQRLTPNRPFARSSTSDNERRTP
jgi:hypothetical protein